MVNKGKTDPVIESTMGLIAKIFVPLKKVSHYFVGVQLIYSGRWYDDMKCGEGKQFYSDGCVYFGKWIKNRRHGLGIQWYNDGNIYAGEWETDFRHGLGVMFYGS